MATPLLIGAGAGLVAAALFVSVAAGTALAGILFCLAPLPICLAGLGWGWRAAAVAALSGTIVASVLGVNLAAFFAVTFAPIAVLCYLALLSRPAPAEASTATALEWYPIGRLVGWAAIIAGALVAALILIGYDPEAYRDSIKQMLESPAFKDLDPEGNLFTDANVTKLTDVFARALPAFLSVAWLSIALFNLWLAGVIIDASGRALRPWPRLDTLELPNAFFLAFTASLIGSYLPGLPGLLASAFAGALLFAYVLQGLAVLHAFSRGMPFRTLLLTAVYLAILFLVWPAIAVAILGLSEPLLHLRERAAARGQSPRQD
jgi:Predicted membrane protein (DUF2232)